MPLTAYSIPDEKELDVYQLLERLSQRDRLQAPSSLDQIPDSWREDIRNELECPCCFVKGAEIIKEAVSRKTGNAVRQACFRFVSPGHRPQCDYAASDKAGLVPPNLVQFGATNSAIVRAVRELVCAGIHSKVFSQRDIRNMREWFFDKKLVASFTVSLDPRLPNWIEKLWRASYGDDAALPTGVPLNVQIAAMPGFNWKAESIRVFRSRHAETLTKIQELRLWPAASNKRVEALAARFQGQVVFDPTVLRKEYELTLALAKFITHNHLPLATAHHRTKTGGAEHVLAFSALLLFVHDWNIADSVAAFASLLPALPYADQTLGNVIGLNPFHDYTAWRDLKLLQEQDIAIPDNDVPRNELIAIEQDLRQKYVAETGPHRS